MANVKTLPNLQALSISPSPAQTLPSEAVLDALKMMLIGASLNEVLTSITRLIEAHNEGMLCSIFLLDEDGLHLRYGVAPNLPQAFQAATDGACIGPDAGIRKGPEIRSSTQTNCGCYTSGDCHLRPGRGILYANQWLLDYTGLRLEEAIAPNLRTRIFHPEDVARVQDERRDALSRGLPFENEQRALGKDGKYRWFLILYNPLRDEHGSVIRWYVTGTDIEDRKQAGQRARNENLALREEIDRSSMYEAIVGSSGALRRVILQIDKVAPTDSTVLISGETGTGKELIASAIHKRSKRSAKAFIRVNCAAIPPSLIASELFGHEKGAFTGALQRRLWRFESADGGTIFLDEIGELSPEVQIALLRVLQEREIERVGSSHPIAVDVRVIVATNQDLEAAVARGAFRADLFYRLNVFPIAVPPLRERVDDVPVLVEYLVERFAKRAGKKIARIEQRTMALLQAYAWPGNVRELQNVIERAVVLCEGETFSIDDSWLKAKGDRK